MKTARGLVLALFCIVFPGQVEAEPPGTGWKLAFEENFNGSSVDTSKWRVLNQEEFKPNNLVVGGGILRIKNVMEGCVKRGGWLDTNTKRRFRYGYYESRLRHEWASRYVWPTWWIWGHHGTTELDVCEWNHWTYDRGEGPSQSHHFRTGGSMTEYTNVDPAAWHTYAVLWEPDRINFFVDGQYRWSTTNPASANDFLYLILSSSPDKNTNPPCGAQLPAFYIDYVKVWQRDNDSILPIGRRIWLKGNNERFVSSENGNRPMYCDRVYVDSWEEFTVVSAGDGKIALRCNNNKYVSSENGNGPMYCNRSHIGAWEEFTAVHAGADRIALRGNNNRYVSSENGSQAMTCNRTEVGAWESFWWSITAR